MVYFDYANVNGYLQFKLFPQNVQQNNFCIVDDFTKVQNTQCMEQTGAALEFSSLTSAISHCAYDKQCSGVYHSCCTERCYLEWNGRFYGHDKKPRLQICPMQSIENLTTGDASTYYQPCTYKKEGRQSRLNTLAILISFEGLEIDHF